ncbi:MAG: type II methionyl aminopeptidase [Nanoarchaeota archaeon]|nr:type II methionyl aminopeptidase [Nanoarchaeota archaeon]
MNENIINEYKTAGTIWKTVRNELFEKLKPGVLLLDLATFAENRIRKLGGEPAFPLNLSINDIAAHSTPSINDKATLQKGDLLKIDMGVSVNGYLADAAFSYCSEKTPLIKAAEAAVAAAIDAIKPGLRVGELGGIIEQAARDHGAQMIINLTGHGIDQYEFHVPPTIPNIASGSRETLEEGMAIAIEPFVCEQRTAVRESAPIEIYRYVTDRPVRSPDARIALALARDTYKGLPFARRQLTSTLSPVKIALAVRELERLGALVSHAPLRGDAGTPIAQAEHTMIVADPVIVTTR